jgi:CheY-like chemotaxis protein/AraC-like DNA-binding protein
MQLFENKKEKELYQAKINFFINISHEIRTPLTLINIPLEKMIKRGKISEEDQQLLALMDKNVSYLIKLANQLLDFQKTETEGVSLTFVNIELIALLKATVDGFRDFANEKGISIHMDTSVKSLDVSIDKEAITKVLNKLFSNAVKYAYSRIIVNLHVSENNQFFIIEFINDGPPINIKEQSKIFDPFYRMKGYGTDQGSGLSLSLVRFLIEKHHGMIQVAVSDQVRTVFRVTIPIKQSNFIEPLQKTSFPAYPIVQDYPYEVNRASLLIVDDENELKSLVSTELSKRYNILCAGNGKEALQIMEETNIQLVISDTLMPVMDGLELLKEIKTNIKFSHIPVILLTEKATMQAKLEGLESGVDVYIDKPFSMDMLLAQISNLLTNRENVRQFYFKSPIANMKSMAYSKADGEFLVKLNAIINEHLNDSDFDVNTVADMLHMSRPTLYRKIKAISHLTPHDLIKIARLKRAAELLIQSDLKIYEIAELVGFNSQSNFWSAFTKQFGVTPSKYAKVNRPKS